MSWSSKTLPWLIPSLFLSAPEGGTIVIISPWVENVELQLFRWEGSTLLEGSQPLTEVIKWLDQERNIHFDFYVREDQLKPTMNWRISNVCRKLSTSINFIGVSDLHAKMIVTDATVLETSANLLTRSLYRNVEAITVRSNPVQDAKVFAKSFFTRHGH